MREDYSFICRHDLNQEDLTELIDQTLMGFIMGEVIRGSIAFPRRGMMSLDKIAVEFRSICSVGNELWGLYEIMKNEGGHNLKKFMSSGIGRFKLNFDTRYNNTGIRKIKKDSFTIDWVYSEMDYYKSLLIDDFDMMIWQDVEWGDQGLIPVVPLPAPRADLWYVDHQYQAERRPGRDMPPAQVLDYTNIADPAADIAARAETYENRRARLERMIQSIRGLM